MSPVTEQQGGNRDARQHSRVRHCAAGTVSAGRPGQKGRVLDEVVAVTGYHREAAIRWLRGDGRPRAGRPRTGRPRVDGAAVAAAKRSQPFVSKLLDCLTACSELALAAETEALLRQASAATLARLLTPSRAALPPCGWPPGRAHGSRP